MKPNGELTYLIEPDSRTAGGGTPQTDRQLVERCLNGEDGAWRELISVCQPMLIRYIRHGLGRAPSNEDFAQELVAQVWFALFTVNRSWLAQYDPSFGMRLTSYVIQFARWKVRNLIRAEQRRIVRELDLTRAARYEVNDSPPYEATGELSEFLEALTPRELEYFTTHLIAWPTRSEAARFSQANGSQLRHRILCKLRSFVGS